MEIKQITEWADKNLDKIIEARRHLHMYPELGDEEIKTQGYLLEALRADGIDCRQIARTGILAWVTGLSGGNVVGARADIDALPLAEAADVPYRSRHEGIMHACGHDAHTAILLGVARFFKQHEKEFKGTVKFFFQPAEESIGGGDRMIKEGCLKDPDVQYVTGLHVQASLDYDQVELKSGVLNASTCDITLIVKGKSSHGASPDRGADAVVIAAQIVTALQTVVSRSVSPMDNVVLTLGKISGGDASNIIADRVEINGTLRTAKESTYQTATGIIKNISSSIARSMGGDCEVIINKGYPALENNSEVLKVIEENAIKYLGADHIVYKEFLSMGGEDFSYFCNATKAAFFHLGCRRTDREPYGLHTRQFDIDERCLKTGVVLQVMNLLSLLSRTGG
jgi:amidohydrolase